MESNGIQWNPIESNGFRRLPQDSRIPGFRASPLENLKQF